MKKRNFKLFSLAAVPLKVEKEKIKFSLSASRIRDAFLSPFVYVVQANIAIFLIFKLRATFELHLQQ